MPKKNAMNSNGAGGGVPGPQFADLAARTLDAARLLVEFREQREGHRLWAEELSGNLPLHLREPVVAYEEAQRLANEAGWHLQRAREGFFYGGLLDLHGQDCELATLACQAAYDQAAARFTEAKDAAQKIAEAHARVSNEIIHRKLTDLGTALRELTEKFETAVVEHERALARITPTVVEVVGWKGPSHCSVMVDLSLGLLRLVESEPGGPNYLSMVSLAKRVSLGREGWDVLEIAVRKEAALLPTPRVSSRRPHAAGTLDERALRLAKDWQRENPGWAVAALAVELHTKPANLIGKRGGKPRCPLFLEFWNAVQGLRASEKMRRQT